MRKVNLKPNVICDRCEHKWHYGGQLTLNCTCPNCLYKVKLGVENNGMDRNKKKKKSG